MVLKKLTTDFSVIGANQSRKLFPYLNYLPRPGQWVYVESQRYGVDRIVAQIVSVSLKEKLDNLYQVEIQLNRSSLTEDILLAKLARKQFDQVDRTSEILEPINFTETSAKTETFTITVRVGLPGYSNANYSNGEFSEP